MPHSVAGAGKLVHADPVFGFKAGIFGQLCIWQDSNGYDYQVKDMRPGIWENPFLFTYNRVMEFIFNTAILYQQNTEAQVFPTIERFDERLPNKTLIWGFDMNNDYVAYTDQFVHENNNLINVQLGGEDVVIAYDEQYKSLGVYHNFTGKKVGEITFLVPPTPVPGYLEWKLSRRAPTGLYGPTFS